MTAASSTTAVIRFLGGESGHRSFFGGTHSRTRVVLIAVFILVGIIATPFAGWPGLAAAVAGVGITFLVTATTHRGSIVDRRRKRSRWARRVASGTDRFIPFDQTLWDQAHGAWSESVRMKDRDSRRAAAGATREIAAMRSHPDGADAMGWLQYGRGEPGIAWHAPVGELAYLSVTFGVAGQLRGIESTAVMARAAEGWGAFLASRAGASALAGGVQITTRVLPADTAVQEFWVLNSLDPSAPDDAVKSYEEVLRLTGADAMVQRHFVTVKWPITADFRDAAEKYADGRNGWRALMKEEIASAVRGLTEARLGHVDVLSARRLAAVLVHQQNPSRPIDFVADVHPTEIGVASRDEFSAHVVTGVDPITHRDVEWWHRTAAIRAEALSTAPRTQLWLLDLLVGTDLQFVRSVSFHIDLIPAAEAKAAARQDLVRDAAEAISKLEAGQVDVDETGMHMNAARRRREDLTSGSHHQGASWIGFVTVSVQSRDELARACRQLQEVCSTSLGIERLDWLDSYQAAASGTTWPIGRGLAPQTASFSSRAYRRLAGMSEKEAIS